MVEITFEQYDDKTIKHPVLTLGNGGDSIVRGMEEDPREPDTTVFLLEPTIEFKQIYKITKEQLTVKGIMLVWSCKNEMLVTLNNNPAHIRILALCDFDGNPANASYKHQLKILLGKIQMYRDERRHLNEELDNKEETITNITHQKFEDVIAKAAKEGAYEGARHALATKAKEKD